MYWRQWKSGRNVCVLDCMTFKCLEGILFYLKFCAKHWVLMKLAAKKNICRMLENCGLVWDCVSSHLKRWRCWCRSGMSSEVYVWLFMSLFYIKFTVCTFTFSALNSTLIINIDVKCSLALWLSLLYCTSYANKQIKKSKANRGSLFMASVCWSGCYKINCSWGNECCVDFSPLKIH